MPRIRGFIMPKESKQPKHITTIGEVLERQREEAEAEKTAKTELYNAIHAEMYYWARELFYYEEGTDEHALATQRMTACENTLNAMEAEDKTLTSGWSKAPCP